MSFGNELPPRVDHMETGVAVGSWFPNHDRGDVLDWLPSAPCGPVERALGRYETAIAEFHGEL
jgi:hypothetical protein